MKSYTVDKLEIGMIVARDVITPKGQVLLKAGIELDEYYIKIFEKYAIEYVVIEDADIVKKTYTEEEVNKLKYDIKQEKKKLFKDCYDDSFMYELFLTVCELELEEILHG